MFFCHFSSGRKLLVWTVYSINLSQVKYFMPLFVVVINPVSHIIEKHFEYQLLTIQKA